MGLVNIFHFKPFTAKSNESILIKIQKTSFLSNFCPILPHYAKIRFFPKIRASSVFIIYGPLTSCKNSEKTNGGKYDNFALLTYLLTYGANFIGHFSVNGCPKIELLMFFSQFIVLLW